MTTPQKITAGSFSRLMEYERCGYRYSLKHREKIPQPENPYAQRGIDLHKAHEDYIKGTTEVIHPELLKFSAEMQSLRERFAAGAVDVEQEWAFAKGWRTCDWRDYDNVWMRIKLDDFVHLSDTVGVVVDLKTGRKYGNEIKHAEQGQLYAGAAFLRYPAKQKIIVEFHYPDQPENDKLSQVEYKPQFTAKALISFERRVNAMLSATSFPPRPNIFNCGYCPYGKQRGNGHCKASA